MERTQLANCRGLAARGNRVDVAYVSEGDFGENWRTFTGEMVEINGTLPRRRTPLGSSLGVVRAAGAVRSLAPDVLYAYRYWDLPFAVLAGRLFGAGVVHHLCLPPPKIVPRWLSAAVGAVDETVAVSRDTASRWAGKGLRPETVSVALTAVDLDHYVPATDHGRATTREGLGLDPEDFLVLYAGRIGREKGVDVLVRAFGRLVERHRASRLVIVGSPSLGSDPVDSVRYQEELEKMAEELPVTWLPGRSDVLGLIQSADVAVVPSLWPEPLSRAVIEPLACGVPVLASNTGGTPEILTDWLSDYMFDAGDSDGLADRLVRLRNWRVLDPELGGKCRRAAEERLSLDAELDIIEQAMKRAANRRHRRRA
ncbi:MAG: glycosyltransferase family 4 protein [Acidimicrobiales bacterium]